MKIIRKTTGFFVRNFFDIRGALGVDGIKQSFSQLATAAKKVLRRSPSNAQTKESFEQAINRLKLTEHDLQAQYKSYQQGFYGYSALTLVLCVYMIHLLYSGFYNASLVCLSVAVLAAIFAFRRHFWMFQIRQRKLGCTWREWKNATLGKKLSQ